ncbi:MAG: hypothetical protein KJ060_08090 [Candidatus Hydrogenedentes bacterium]|nr:hypothetical protein [Candidatus Hydrogenedentota bacterium]
MPKKQAQQRAVDADTPDGTIRITSAMPGVMLAQVEAKLTSLERDARTILERTTEIDVSVDAKLVKRSTAAGTNKSRYVAMTVLAETCALRQYIKQRDIANIIDRAFRLGQAEQELRIVKHLPELRQGQKTLSGLSNSRNKSAKHDAIRERAGELRREFPSYTPHRIAGIIRDEHPGKTGYGLSSIKLRIRDLWPVRTDSK